jgi:glycosyltransferase involved in cell wall biosynthesis
MSIRLTIITPVFNGNKYIEKCLKNVASQAFPEMEHLIMDGDSTDGTVEIIQKWMVKYPHIRLISEKDNGQSNAMNKGIKQAQGNIIGFLNVDDYYEPEVLGKILPIFESLAEPSFVCGNLNIWMPDGSLKHFNRPNRLSLPELLSDKFEWPYNPSAYFYHKTLHDKTGFYNEGNHYCMDYEFILESARHTQLRHIDQLWGNFCQVAESKTIIRYAENLAEASAEGKALRDAVILKLDSSQKAELDQILLDFDSKNNVPQKQNLLRRILKFIGI